jgi:hypothetical protein
MPPETETDGLQARLQIVRAKFHLRSASVRGAVLPGRTAYERPRATEAMQVELGRQAAVVVRSSSQDVGNAPRNDADGV